MRKATVRFLSVAVTAIFLAAPALSAFAAGGGGGGGGGGDPMPPPPPENTSKNTKKKGKKTSFIEEPRFLAGYRAALEHADLQFVSALVRRADFRREVYAFMEALLTTERVDSPPEVGRKPAIFDRRQRRQEFPVRGVADQQCFQHAELVRALFELPAEFTQHLGKFIDGKGA